MAFITKTIGPELADFFTVTDHKNDWDGLGNGQYHGKLIGDISDTTIMNSVSGTNIDLKYTGDAASANRRTITADGAARILELNDSGVTTGSLILEDLDLDGDGVATRGIANLNGWNTALTIRRLRLSSVPSVGLDGDAATWILENVLVDRCGTGFSISDAGTYTVKNCGAYKNTGRGFDIGTQASRTYNFFNCAALDNDIDFRLINGASLRNNTKGVSSDDTATKSTWDDSDASVINKTTFTDPVFVDFANNDFHKNESDFDSWGISGNSGDTPTLDLDGVTRVNHTIGPLEFIPAAAGGAGSLVNRKSRLTALVGGGLT